MGERGQILFYPAAAQTSTRLPDQQATRIDQAKCFPRRFEQEVLHI